MDVKVSTEPLDLFSTSQTKRRVKNDKKEKFDRKIYDECLNNAPYFAYHIDGKKFGVVQGCCNSWLCPKCGQQRAREEYGRIVVGAREMSANNQLYLFTITCRGKEMGLDEAERSYMEWTNRLLTRLRTETKRAGKTWAYASVTERQKREHPHSHFITTYCPADAVPLKKGEIKYYETLAQGFPAKHATLQSYSLEHACTECGLGCQYDISRLESVEAGSRYAAKYLFKDSIFQTIWPKGWKRVRYSQNWPKLPKKEGKAFVLLTAMDWGRLAREALIIKTPNDGVQKAVAAHIGYTGVIIQ